MRIPRVTQVPLILVSRRKQRHSAADRRPYNSKEGFLGKTGDEEAIGTESEDSGK